MCTKQHLSSIWNSIHEKVKQHWGWVGKKVLLIKKRVKHYIVFINKYRPNNPLVHFPQKNCIMSFGITKISRKSKKYKDRLPKAKISS